MRAADINSRFSINWRTMMGQSRYPWMYGYFHLCVGGVILGKPDEIETLNAILACSKDWQNFTKIECSRSLFLLPTLPAFLSVEFSMYGLEHLRSIVPKDFKPIALEDVPPCQFDAGESSDTYRLYVLARDGNVRLLFNDRLSEPREVVISAVQFDAEVMATIAGLEKDFQILREISSANPN